MQQQSGYIIFNEKNKKKRIIPRSSIFPESKKNKEQKKEIGEEISDVEDYLDQDKASIEGLEESSEERLQTLIKSSEEFEFRFAAKWFFEVFPNEVIIDIHKVSFIDKTFLFKNVTSIFIKDIAKVEVTNDIFFATLEIINVTETICLKIKHLEKDDARTALALIQGLMVGYKNNIDLARLDPENTFDELMKLGSPVI
jgi:hypothetical protein